MPEKYDAAQKWPLVLFLHGSGESGADGVSQTRVGLGPFIATYRHKCPFIAVFPQSPNAKTWFLGPEAKVVFEILDKVQREYNVDPDRIYLTGHSMGGYGTWSVAMSHPDVFAALAPISGGSNTPAGMSKIAHIPQLVVHGDTDPTVPVERSRVMVAEGKKLGAEIKYIEVPGGDHGSVVAPNFPAVFEWFDTHKRKGAAAGAAAGSSKNK